VEVKAKDICIDTWSAPLGQGAAVTLSGSRQYNGPQSRERYDLTPLGRWMWK